MIRMQKIIVPTDFSEYSRAAIAYACELADKFGAELHLLHVVQDLVALVPEPGLAFPPPGDFVKEMQASAEKGLSEILDPAWSASHQVVRVVRHGPPYVEIVRYAREVDADLIVLTTHGRSGLAHVLLGSVAEKVVRKAEAPVLTIRPEGVHFEMP